MLGDYGTDDMLYMAQTSDIPGTVTVSAYGRTYHLPVGVFDNRSDLTTFLRQDAEKWEADQVRQVTAAIRAVTDAMWAVYG